MPSGIGRVPRAVSRRVRTRVARYRHGRRAALSDRERLERALRPGVTIADALAALREPPEPRFLLWPGDKGPLGALPPDWTERVKADADRIAAGSLRLLGEDDLRVDRPLPWHEDPIHGYAWDPDTFYRQVPVPEGRADIKVPWELSRFQHLPTLGMAYAATGDPRYAAEVVDQLSDWIARNPPGFGVNWACTMDVAIRAVNWVWACHLVAGAPQAGDAFLTPFLASLADHGEHIAANVEIYEGGLTTNHTLADYVGLVVLGLLLPELRDAEGWARAGLDGTAACMREQVHEDGVAFESSIPYHRLVLEMFLAVQALADRTGRPLPDGYRESLARMVEFVLHYTRPDGLAPLIGDSDDGRLHILDRYFDWEPRDHRYLLAAGGALLEREDLVAAGAGAPGAVEETAWLLGAEAAGRVAGASGPAAAPASRAFAASGRYVIRHGDHHAVVCADETGTRGLGNHKHNDLLAYELSVDRRAVVVDLGSYAYTSDLDWRERFRCTEAHNTVAVDGEEQNRPVGPFGMRTDARVRVHEWSPGEGTGLLDASHTGYERLAAPVVHRRRIAFRTEPFEWVVVDELQGEGEHDVVSSLHLAPGTRLEAAPEGLTDALRVAAGDVALLVVPSGPLVPAVESGWFAPRFGQKVEIPVLRLRGRVRAGERFGYAIVRA